MPVSKWGTSRCGFCRYYVHEGRRGGQCSQLDVPVSSDWKACSLAVSPFEEKHDPKAEAMNSSIGIRELAASKLAANNEPKPVSASTVFS